MTKPSPVVKMPVPIERCVRKQNVLYLHNRNQFSAEYFRFMRRLLLCNIPHGQQSADEKLVNNSAAHDILHVTAALNFCSDFSQLYLAATSFFFFF